MGGSALIADIVERKRAMRAAAIASRAAAGDGQLDGALIDAIVRQVTIPAGSVVAGIWPLPGEPDLRPLLSALHDRGHMVVLPETPPRGQVLLFRRWAPGCPMLPGRFATSYPDGVPVVPEIVFVPLLAFDRTGYRLGYGGGYYDRTLAALPGCLSVGFGRAAQQVAMVPRELHDLRLDMIITEKGMLALNPRA